MSKLLFIIGFLVSLFVGICLLQNSYSVFETVTLSLLVWILFNQGINLLSKEDDTKSEK